MQESMQENRDIPEDKENQDMRAAWAIGFSRAAEISNVGLQFVLPTLAGWWLDEKFQMPHVGLGIGLVLGMGLALLSLLHLVRQQSPY